MEIQPEQPDGIGGPGPGLHARPGVLAAVAIGGALGAPARYGVALAITITPGSFPWGTFWINTSGSAMLGIVLAVLLRRYPSDRYLRPFLAVGFLGGYTTFSTFSFETVRLLEEGEVALALRNVGLTLALGLTAAALGLAVAR